MIVSIKITVEQIRLCILSCVFSSEDGLATLNDLKMALTTVEVVRTI